jgi:hypothetical protein
VGFHHSYTMMAGQDSGRFNRLDEDRGPRSQLRCRLPALSRLAAVQRFRKRLAELVSIARRTRHQSEVVLLDFVRPDCFAAFFRRALRFLVAVLSDLSGCSSVLNGIFSKLSRRP